ncbi:MAG TPA: hypothetical protein VFJ45_09175, partial [bacterium]|nr:hypothetical protein [bacterium]
LLVPTTAALAERPDAWDDKPQMIFGIEFESAGEAAATEDGRETHGRLDEVEAGAVAAEDVRGGPQSIQ